MKADGSDQEGKGAASTGKEVAKRPLNLYKMLENTNVQKRFEKSLGERAPAFLSSILSVVKGNPILEKCDPAGVLGAAATAAELDLPIEPSLGLAAIIPYKDRSGIYHAQFQIMTKGLMQLALRSSQYETIYVGPVYRDEFKGIDIVTGEPIIEPVADGLRAKDSAERAEEEDGVCGWIGYFKLLSGFVHKEYWSNKKITAHGRRYSKSFTKELGLWQTNRPAMNKKTVMKNMISHHGAMSTQLLGGLRADQSEIKVANLDSESGELDKSFTYVDNPESGAKGEDSDIGDGVTIGEEEEKGETLAEAEKVVVSSVPAGEKKEEPAKPEPEKKAMTPEEFGKAEVEKANKAFAEGLATETTKAPSLAKGRPGAVPGQTVREVPAAAKTQPAAGPSDDLDIF